MNYQRNKSEKKRGEMTKLERMMIKKILKRKEKEEGRKKVMKNIQTRGEIGQG